MTSFIPIEVPSVIEYKSLLPPLEVAFDIPRSVRQFPSKKSEKNFCSEASGDSSIPGALRRYISVTFEINSKPKAFYFSQDALLQDVIQKISEGQVGTSFVLSSAAYPWYCWHEDRTLSSLVANYEEVSLLVVTSEALENAKLKRESAIEAYNLEKQTLLELEKLALQEKEAAALEAVQYSKGDIIEYIPKSNIGYEQAPRVSSPSPSPTSSDEAATYRATIISVHMDDFPNIYYTVRISLKPIEEENTRGIVVIGCPSEEGSYRELQTYKKRMRMIAPFFMAPVPQSDGGLDIRVAFASRQYFIAGVPPLINITKLRAYIAQATLGIIPSIELRNSEEKIKEGEDTATEYLCKLSFKGKVLRNENKSLKDHKIGNMARIEVE